MNKFKKNKYLVVKKAINIKVADFVKDYLTLKKKVAETITKNSNGNKIHPTYGAIGDTQVKGTFNMYGDPATDTLLKNIKPLMEKKTGLKLIETYSYCRVYKKGDILKRHKDRPSCEISTTLNLGGDSWPIYLDPTGKENKKGIKIDLKQGDMLIYSGCDLEHWREAFKGKSCVQVFLHYNKKNERSLKYDGRLHLGLPSIKEISISDKDSDFLML